MTTYDNSAEEKLDTIIDKMTTKFQDRYVVMGSADISSYIISATDIPAGEVWQITFISIKHTGAAGWGHIMLNTTNSLNTILSNNTENNVWLTGELWLKRGDYIYMYVGVGTIYYTFSGVKYKI